jgi:hypothetical protein
VIHSLDGLRLVEDPLQLTRTDRRYRSMRGHDIYIQTAIWQQSEIHFARRLLPHRDMVAQLRNASSDRENTGSPSSSNRIGDENVAPSGSPNTQ